MAGPEVVKEIVRQRVIRPIARFIESQASSGVLLLLCTVVALVWANSAWGASYSELWHRELSIGFGESVLSMSLLHWINDGLMAVFFLLVGLEIKREVLVGELATPRLAALPIVAAVGGMVLPALVYVVVNRGQPGMDGWAIPMATDIAFSLGILALLGSRAPLALKVFLTALAIVDDLGAVVVIALFYSHDMNWAALGAAGGLFAVLVLMNVLTVRSLVPYLVVGALMWAAMLGSGVHATIAGVLLALTIPTRVRLDSREFLRKGRELLDRFEEAAPTDAGSDLLSDERQSTLHAIETSVEGVQMPLQRLESELHTPVNFVVMPLFALANAGVVLTGVGMEQVTAPVTLGVALGLFLGKALGITLFSWLGVRLGFASLPKRVQWRHILGVGFLGGIGFTMSLFIAGLAFTDVELNTGAKLGILLGSLLSGIVGAVLISKVRTAHPQPSVETE
jgi:NhaA family Na+:H+ antiporter